MNQQEKANLKHFPEYWLFPNIRNYAIVNDLTVTMDET